MLRFVLRRFLQMIPLLLGVSFISFAVMKMAPGDFLTQMRENPQVLPETVDRLRHNFGLDKPWIIQYVLWLKNALMGNFGESFTYKMPVFILVRQYALNTLLLAGVSMIISWLVAIPMGVYAAVHKNGTIDRI